MNAERKTGLGTTRSLESCAGRDRNRKLRVTLRNSRRAIFRELDADTDGNQHLTRLALDEAEAIAWQTGFPQLVFPSLAEEKVRAVANWSRRQQLLRRQPSLIEGFSE